MSSSINIDGNIDSPPVAAAAAATADIEDVDTESLDLSFDDLMTPISLPTRTESFASNNTPSRANAHASADGRLSLVGGDNNSATSFNDQAAASLNVNDSNNAFGSNTTSATSAAVASKNNKDDDYNDKYHNNNSTHHYNSNDWNDDYILGTLLVRVVAARNVQLPRSTSGNNRHRLNNNNLNVYALVRLGTSMQRTSYVWQASAQPLWPRTEVLYMDVLHPPIDHERVMRNYDNDESGDFKADDDDVDEGGVGSSYESLDYDSHSDRKPSFRRNSSSRSSAPHPGDPPRKDHSVKSLRSSFHYDQSTFSTTQASTSAALHQQQPPPPILTVTLFHTQQQQHSSNKKYNPEKSSGDSDDVFLGMAALDLTPLFTGQERVLDDWYDLHGMSDDSKGSRASIATVRLVCEYEPSDVPPRVGDLVVLSRYVPPEAYYPAPANEVYKVAEYLDGDSSNHDNIVINRTTRECWVSSYVVHKHVLIVVHRHVPVVDACRSEWQTLQQRWEHSPAWNVVQATIQERLPEQGLVSVGVDVAQQGVKLFSKWFSSSDIIQTAIQDVVQATNLDGRYNPAPATSLATASFEDDDDDNFNESVQQHNDNNSTLLTLNSGKNTTHSTHHSATTKSASHISSLSLPLPNMPACPITGEPMVDPVVAADGHTYERAAIARWLQTSNKSPLTGSVLQHKNLVPNYMLLSSLQEANVNKNNNNDSIRNSTVLTLSSMKQDGNSVNDASTINNSNNNISTKASMASINDNGQDKQVGETQSNNDNDEDDDELVVESIHSR